MGNPHIIVYVYFRDRKLLRTGTPRRPAKVDKTLRGGMPGATAPRSPFRLKELKRLGSDPDATVIFLMGNRMKKKTSDKTDMERGRHDERRSEKREGLKSALRVRKFVVFCARRSAPSVSEPESELLSLLDS